VLLAAAELLPRRAVGIDLWRPDQTGNSIDATLRNAAREGVAVRVALHRDMTRLPFADEGVAVVPRSATRCACCGPAGGSCSPTSGTPAATAPTCARPA